MEQEQEQYVIKTIQTAICVLGILKDGPRSLIEIAREAEITKNNAYRILVTFKKIGWVRQDLKTKQYDIDEGVVSPALSYLARNSRRVIEVHEPIENGEGSIGWVSAIMVVPNKDDSSIPDACELIRDTAAVLSLS